MQSDTHVELSNSACNWLKMRPMETNAAVPMHVTQKGRLSQTSTPKVWEKKHKFLTRFVDFIQVKIYFPFTKIDCQQNEMFLSFSNSKLRIWCVRPVIGWADSSMSSSESAWESTGGDCFSVTWLQHINCWNDGVHLGWCFKSFFGNCFKGTWWDFQSFRCSI